MRHRLATRYLLTLAFLLVLALPAHAQKRILILGWNVESGGNVAQTIEERLQSLEGYDILGLTEVRSSNASRYAEAAEEGEGARGSANPDFKFKLGSTGGSDRMMIIWDAKRFDLVGEPQELHDINDGNHRSPLVARFKLKNTDIEFLFMVNHLARVNGALRESQATGLKVWAQQQTLPIIAVGDYNFDYSIDDGEGNQAMRNMLEGGIFQWVKPPELFQTQDSARFFSVLDFMFIAHKPDNWRVDSKILAIGFPFPDDNQRSDHRPIQGRVLIFPN